jgi:23S rRNA (uracil1939-C5)-methyltransferase
MRYGLLAGAGTARHLVDLCAGVGAFALALADTAARVTAVESVPQAAADARESARLSGLDLDVVEAPVERFAERLPALAPDRLVVDPPRRGLSGDVVAAIGRAAPARVAWIACDPETGARDVAALAPFDLVLRGAVPFELFAGSAEVEGLLRVEHVPGSWRPEVLARGAGWCVALKPALLPVRAGAGGGPDLAGAVGRALGGAWAPLRAQAAPPAGASGATLLVTPDAPAAALRALAAGASTEVLALVRGVPRAKGWLPVRGPRLRYVRETVVGGYGLVRVAVPGLDLTGVPATLAAIGHPVLGDPGGDPRANRFLAEVGALHRPFLHAVRLALTAPDGAPVDVAAPLPPDLSLVLQRLVAARISP